MGHYKNKLFQRRREAATTPARRGSSGGGGGSDKGRKHITFELGRNTVSMVKPPPRARNRDFWFTASPRVERKSLTFELAPSSPVEVTVDCRMQLLSIALAGPSADGSAAPGASGASGKKSKSDHSGKASRRVGLEVCEASGLSAEAMRMIRGMDPGDAAELLQQFEKARRDSEGGDEKWFCVGTVAATPAGSVVERVRVMLPPGVYKLRAVGGAALQVFAQVWDIEEQLT